jgi:hypothetical protein
METYGEQIQQTLFANKGRSEVVNAYNGLLLTYLSQLAKEPYKWTQAL